MNSPSRAGLKRWVARYVPKGARIADVGAYDINGSVKEELAYRDDLTVVGFDVVPGPGVDVVVTDAGVPTEHMWVYDAVTAVCSIQHCGDVPAFAKRLWVLGMTGAPVYVNMCANNCDGKHSQPENPYGWNDCNRFTPAELREALAPYVDCIACRTHRGDTHRTLHYYGRVA
jgi:hypothetical protein